MRCDLSGVDEENSNVSKQHSMGKMKIGIHNNLRHKSNGVRVVGGVWRASGGRVAGFSGGWASDGLVGRMAWSYEEAVSS